MNGYSKIFTESALQCARLIKSQQQTVNFDFDKCSLRGNKENSAINSYVPHANGDIKKVQRNFKRGRKRVARADSLPVRAAGQNILFPNASVSLFLIRAAGICSPTADSPSPPCGFISSGVGLWAGVVFQHLLQRSTYAARRKTRAWAGTA